MSERDAVIERALAALGLPEKVRLLSGRDFWTLPSIDRIGLGSLVMSDGPIGIRGIRWTPEDPSVALPSPTALAATWDPALARTAGRLLGQEARRAGVHVLLAPTVNLHRSPLGGRHFECYSEDPLLTAEIGVGYVRGLQDQGVGATVKHFVANDSETARMTVDVRVAERALRELYLAPFERIVAAGVWAVMAGYNGVNGATMTEHAGLLRDVLKKEWGFDGVVISDWTAARSAAPAANGGLDVVMPAAGDPWGDALVAAVRAGAVAEEVIDDKVRRVLRLAARVGILDGVPSAAPEMRAPLDGSAVTREVAIRSFVLARNTAPRAAAHADDAAHASAASTHASAAAHANDADDAGTGSGTGTTGAAGREGWEGWESGDGAALLPLDAGRLRRVAVLGALAADARIQGGGSAQVAPARVISPLEGLAAALPGVAVTHAVGADPRPWLPAAAGVQWTPITATLRDAGGRELFSTVLDAATLRWLGEPPDGVDPGEIHTIELAARCTPLAGGDHQFALHGFGLLRLTVAGEQLFDGPLYQPGDDATTVFPGPVERRFTVPLVAGRPVDVLLSQRVVDGRVENVTFGLGHAGPETGVGTGPAALLDEAVRVAAGADVAIVVVGTTEEVESEGFDRATLALPGHQDELVARVAAVNPRTVVVVNAGSPVLMPWVDAVAAVLLTWFPGQQAGAALADVLLGVAEPGGRLPTTWPRRAEDCPVLSTIPVEGVLDYREGILVGYRGWRAEPLFPFGHGLGYTTWAYESLVVEAGPAGPVAVVTVRNTGGRGGREVVQVYAGPAEPEARPVADPGPAEPDADRPARWLAGFATVAAAPGEAVTVRVPLPERTFQVWEGGWRTVPGRYRLEAARSVAERPLAVELTI